MRISDKIEIPDPRTQTVTNGLTTQSKTTQSTMTAHGGIVLSPSTVFMREKSTISAYGASEDVATSSHVDALESYVSGL